MGMTQSNNPMWEHEKETGARGYARIAGVDEAGRGPLAGPVVSAAVILPLDFAVEGITDSKKLSAAKRASLFERIYDQAISIGIGIVDPVEIDRINILQAALLSMVLAVERLSPRPDFLLIDGQFTIKNDLPQKAIIGGDGLSVSIASASIVAKVSRDRLMDRYHLDYPEFDFHVHKGYPTKAHREAIRKFGPSPIHRRSFKGVRETWTQLELG
jgi:ribonuclease HII